MIIFKVSLAYIVGSYVTAALAIVLNSVEIHLLRKVSKKLTSFEVILLNLAISDTLVGIGTIVTTSISLYLWSTKLVYPSLGAVPFYYMVLPLSTSTLFVLVIAIERLFAIKSPLKHRIKHQSRRTTVKYVACTWLVTITISIIGVGCSSVLVKREAQEVAAYILGSLLLFGVLLNIVFYIWIARLMIGRSWAFFGLGRINEANKELSVISVMHKEKNTLIVCALVVFSFIVCNVPFAICLTRLEIPMSADLLVIVNSIVNPMIYFFKGYIDKRIKERKTPPRSQDNEGYSNHDVETPAL